MQNDTVKKQLALLDSKPFFDVELSAACNLHCTMCPHGKITRPKGTMAGEVLEGLAGWLPPGAHVVLSGLGEPLLHPETVSFVVRLKERGHTVALTTSGVLLDGKTAEGLISSGLDILYLSFPSLDPGVYETIMRGARFDSVMENLRRWSRLKPPDLRAYLAVTVLDGNRAEVGELKVFASSLGFTPYVRPVHSRAGILYDPGLPVSKQRAPCGIFAKVTFVDWRGDVLACCNDPAGETRLGSVLEDDFESIRAHKRDLIETGTLFPPCARCDDDFRSRLLETVSFHRRARTSSMATPRSR